MQPARGASILFCVDDQTTKEWKDTGSEDTLEAEVVQFLVDC